MQPLKGVKVLDFSTLLPGPLTTLLLAEAGAEIIKVERPQRGDEMRTYTPRFGDDSVNFALLNRGKRSITVDLKDPDDRERLQPLIQEADIVLEQFRPGVMDRLGLGYESLSRTHPRIIYCSITGYGQDGPRSRTAAHDLNYVAETGLLGLSAGPDGSPVLPPALIADIAGGTYPAVINILLALRERDQTGKGGHLDIAMADGMFTFMYWALGESQVAGHWPQPGGELVTGGSPRYQIYRTSDDRYIAAAPLEQKFWDNFCQLIGLPEQYWEDTGQESVVKDAVAEQIRSNSANHWREVFAGQDVCCSVVATLQEAMVDPQFLHRSLFTESVANELSQEICALPVPVARNFREASKSNRYPNLGESNQLLRKGQEKQV
ncbi:CoA transferase [Marinobacter sp. Z-F4-2]|nr:CoA transferase [Marinobacter sp. Z-F4-2]